MSSGHQIITSQNNTSVHQTSNNMAQASGAGAGVASQQQQQQQASQQQQQQGQQQQQIHLQQSTTTTQIHAGVTQQQQQQQQQHHHTAQATNPMQQLQLIQQPLQNQYLQQLQYSTQQGGPILMNGNLALHHPGINPQIQVIAAGKTFQSNQLGHQILNTSYTAIPTTAANNQQAYIIGQLINSQGGLLQQTHQQQGKPGEMQKVLSPQIGTQLPQGLWTSPHIFSNLSPNPIFIRGGQPDQMFIQQQQPLHTNTSTHQHFSMQPITTPGQIPTSMANAANIQAAQQQQQQQQQQNTNVQQAGSQQQNNQQIAPQPIQPQPANVVSIKGPATLQPKPLQIQPQPAQSAQQQQQQTLQQQQQSTLQQQIQQVTMAHQHQLQIIPQPPTSSHTGVLSQPLITGQNAGTITMQTSAGPHQIQTQQTPRHLTILPQQQPGQTIQSQVSILQQSQQQQQQGQPGQQQHQPIRPNFTIVTQGSPANVTVSQVSGPAAGATQPGQQQQRPKAKKVVSKGGQNASTPNTTPQANKTVFPRPVQPATSVAPITSQYLNNGTLTLMQAKPTTLQSTGATLTKVNVGASPTGQQMMQPLKTINISALHSNLPDATLTPLMPTPAAIAASVSNQVSQQPVQVYPATTTQLPSPVVSITPAPPPPQQQQPPQQPTTPSKKDEAESGAMDTKNDTEKENAKTNGEESEDTTVKQNKPPKAMVKPQVLTHVIEGFVIQEASEPFPMPRNGELDEPPKKKAALSIGAAEMGKCEMCGKVDLKAKFKKNKRFCSSACAKSSKNANQQQQQTQQQQTQLHNNLTNGTANNADGKSKQKNKKWADGDGELTDETNSSVGDASTLSPTEDQHDEEPKVNPVKWSVSEVVEFVKSLPGCSEYAEDFAVQEIDGQALLLLKEDHLMSAIGMKLGPALKLCAKIEGIRSSSGGAANGDAGANKA